MHIDHSIPAQHDPDWDEVKACPIVESSQPLIDTADTDERIATDPAYARLGFAHALPRCHVRQGLLERLIGAAHRFFVDAGDRRIRPDPEGTRLRTSRRDVRALNRRLRAMTEGSDPPA